MARVYVRSEPSSAISKHGSADPAERPWAGANGGTPPVAPEEALEIMAFRDAAQERARKTADGRRAYADIAPGLIN